MDNTEQRIRLLEEQVIRLTRENQAISKLYKERVKPVVDSFWHYYEISKDECFEVMYK